VLLGDAPGVRVARGAAVIATGLETAAMLQNRGLDRLRGIDQIHRRRIMTLASTRASIAAARRRRGPRDRRRRRPGRLLRNHRRDDSRRCRLQRPRWVPRRDGEHARRRPPHLDVTVLWDATMSRGRLTVAHPGGLQPGDIILLHWGPSLLSDLQALFPLIDAAGLHPAPLQNYLGPTAKPPAPHSS
jgi:hypothetical protein